MFFKAVELEINPMTLIPTNQNFYVICYYHNDDVVYLKYFLVWITVIIRILKRAFFSRFLIKAFESLILIIVSIRIYRFSVPSYTGYRDIVVNIKVNLPSPNDTENSNEFENNSVKSFENNLTNITNNGSNENRNENEFIESTEKMSFSDDKKYDNFENRRKNLTCEIQIHLKEILNFSKKIQLRNSINVEPYMERTQYISSYDQYLHFRQYFSNNKNNAKQYRIRIKVLEKMNQIYGSPDSLEKFIMDFLEVFFKFILLRTK